MNNKFEKVLNELYSYITELGEPSGNMDNGANVPQDMNAQPMDDPNAAPPPQPEQPASQGFTLLTQLLSDALRTDPNAGDVNDPKFRIKSQIIKLSNNNINNTDDAYKYIDIIKSTLPTNDSNNINNFITSGGTFDDMDDNKLIEFAKLIKKAYFDTTKMESPSDTLDSTSQIKITPQNARQIFANISNQLSGESV